MATLNYCHETKFLLWNHTDKDYPRDQHVSESI
jgi:hypothetical protein